MILPPSPEGRTPLQYEAALLVHNVRRVRDHFLNRTFNLTLEGAQGRKRTLIILLLAMLLLIAIFTHPLGDWITGLSNLFIWALNPLVRQSFTTNPISDLIVLAVGSVSNLFRFFAILVFPYWAAVHAASLFLADIFEKPAWIARSFIGQVALGGSGETISIENGEFLDKEISRIYAIGGPGFVSVDRNSAALFEKFDGRPHVIGPTIEGPVRLDGFERFRSVIDLRDQQIEMRDQASREITSRSLDGVPVSAIDVSMRFSVWRGAEKPRTLLDPNPFKEDLVIEDLVYNQALPVQKLPRPKDTPPDIPSPVGDSASELIRSELSRFMSERRLSEFLASYGIVEVNAAQTQARTILEKTQTVIPPGVPAPEINVPSGPPSFTPRTDISALFNEGFSAQANHIGLQLDWIGVGTWKTPAAIIPEHHLEAWKLSLENNGRGSEAALQQVERDARQTKTIQIIQNAPLARHRENLADPQMKYKERAKRLLVSYLEQLTEARELMQSKENESLREPLEKIEDAIDYITDLLEWKAYHSGVGREPGQEPNFSR